MSANEGCRCAFAPVNILMYHNVEDGERGAEYNHFYVLAAEFRRQMQRLLRAGYRPCTLGQVGGALAGSAESGLTDKSFVVTFDDGYQNLLRLVHPFLRSMEIPYTVFLVSDRIGQTSDWVIGEGFAPSPLLSWSEIDEMREWNGVSFQAHTCTHPRLDRLSHAEAFAEMNRCRQDLEQHLGTKVDHICYPYGSVSTEVAEMAAEIGFRLGVTTEFGRARPGDDPLRLPRVSVHHVPLISVKYGLRASNFWWRIKTRKDRR